MAQFWIYSLSVIIIIGIEIYKSSSISHRTKSICAGCILCSLPFLITLVTFHQCYTLSFAQKRFAEWCITPWISFLGVYQPNIFAIGLTSVAISTLIINYIFIGKILVKKNIIIINNFNARRYSTDWMLSHNLEIAAILITITGWINVDHDVVTEFLSTNIQTMSWNVGWKATVHVSSVMAFFAICWINNVIIVMRFNININEYMIYSYYFKIFMIILIAFCFTVLGNAWIYVVFLANIDKDVDSFYIGHNIVGLAQYAAVFSYCIFWLSFGYDYVMVCDNKKY